MLKSIVNFFRSKPIVNNSGMTSTSFFMNSGYAETVTPDTALNITTVYACVKVLSESVATLPLALYQKKQNKKEKLSNKLTKKLKKPNAFMTDYDMKTAIMTDLCLNGNSFWQIVRNGLLEVTGIYPLHTKQMAIKLLDSGDIVYVYNTGKNGQVQLNSDEVLHFKMATLDGIIGISPITYNQLALSTAKAQSNFTDNYYKNGSNSSIVITHPQIMSDEAFERFKKSIDKNYSGSANSHKPIILEDGVKIDKLSMTNSDSQFIEQRIFSKNEIASIFRVPPHMVNEMSSSTFSNISHQSLSFVKYTLMPYLTMIESELNDKLLTSDRQYFKFNANALLRGDIVERYKAYNIGISSGFLSRNEVRALEDMDEIDGLDEMLVPQQSVQVTKDGQEVQKLDV